MNFYRTPKAIGMSNCMSLYEVSVSNKSTN